MLQSVRKYSTLWAFAAITLISVAPAAFLSLEDSEIWGITSSRQLLTNSFLFSGASMRPLFSAVLATALSLVHTNWDAFVVARGIAIFWSLISLFNWFLITRDLSERRNANGLGLALVVIGISMPLMVLHFTKVRPDLMSTSIFLSSMTFILLRNGAGDIAIRRTAYILGCVLLLMTTFKAFDFVVALGFCFYLHERPYSDRPMTLSWLIGPAAAVAMAVAAGSPSIVTRSIIYWVDSYKGADSFFAQSNWILLERVALTSAIATSLLAIGFIAGIKFFRRFDSFEKTLLFSGLVSLTFILIHSQKFPFFLASRVPILFLGALPGLMHLWNARWFERLSASTRSLTLIAVPLISLGVSITHLTSPRVLFAFNFRSQKNLLDEIETYINKSGNPAYWDALGLLPLKNGVFHYPSPYDRSNSEILNYVEEKKPVIVLRTTKMALLEPYLSDWLRKHYLPINDEIWTRSLRILFPNDCALTVADTLKLAQSEGLAPPLALFQQNRALNQWTRTPIQLSGSASKDSLSITDSGLILSRYCRALAQKNEREAVSFALTEVGPHQSTEVPPFGRSFAYDGYF